MKIKLFALIILSVLISACATEQKSQFSEFNSEVLYPNKRIVFRDVTITQSTHRYNISRKRLLKIQTDNLSKNHIQPSFTTISAYYPISNHEYGESIDDRFNDVSKVAVMPRRVVRFRQYDSPKDAQLNNSYKRNVSQSEISYALLSFPERPPEELIKKFHMQIQPRIQI